MKSVSHWKFEEVKDVFESKGLILHETEYKNTLTDMDFTCKKHYEEKQKIKLKNLLKGYGCKQCSNEMRRKAKILPYETIKSAFSDRDYVLLDEEYKGSHEKLNYKCKKHPDKKISITYNNLKCGKGCPYCAREKLSESMRFEYEYVFQKFQEKGYRLLETEYIDSYTRMRYECVLHKNKETTMSYNDLQQGTGCPHCAGNTKKEKEEVWSLFAENGYEILNQPYEGSNKKLKYVCPKHPHVVQEISYSKLKNGRGCSLCGYEVVANKLRKPFDEVKALFEKRGYVLLEKHYVNCSTPMRFICPKHDNKENLISYEHLQRGLECKQCSLEKRSGEGSIHWKGGLTTLNLYLRSTLIAWRAYYLNKYDFKCVITGDTVNLEVHHEIPFNVLRDEVLKELSYDKFEKRGEYSEEELETIKNALIEKHSKVQGFPLRKDIHKSFHSMYGYNADKDDFDNFVSHFENKCI